MPSQRIKADLLIDGGGGVITEVSSSAFSSLFPPIYPFVRIGSELYFGGIWESAVNRYDWRDGLTELLTPKPELCYYPNEKLSFDNTLIKIPQPIQPTIQSTGTPHPITPHNDIALGGNINTTPDLSLKTEEKILPTQTPSPSPSPSP